LDSVCPVVVQIPAVLDAFYQQSDFSSHADEFLYNSITVALRHVSLSGGSSSSKIDVEYGKGSFWLVPGDAFSMVRTSLAKKDRRYQEATHGGNEPQTRAAFEHYADHRSILLSANPDEDEPGNLRKGAAADDEEMGGHEEQPNTRRKQKHSDALRRRQVSDDAAAAARRDRDIGRQLLQISERQAADFQDNHIGGTNEVDGGGGDRRHHKNAEGKQHDEDRNDNPRRGGRRGDEETKHHRRQEHAHHRGDENTKRRRRSEHMKNFSLPLLTETLDVTGVPNERMSTPRDLNALLTFVHGLAKTEACVVRLPWTVRIREKTQIERPCLFVLEDRVQIIVERGGDVLFAGDGPTQPILFTSFDAASTWGGMVIEDGGSLTLRHTMLHFVGSTGVQRVAGTGSHIKRYAPAITLSPIGSSQLAGGGGTRGAGAGKQQATLIMEDSAILNCEGSAFALGKGSQSTILRTLVQDVAQGGECVSCKVNISHSHFIDFPFVSNLSLFVDGDNDAFYFRGGEASVSHSVFLNALDDGIDSASSAGDPDHSKLHLHHVAIENCQHEGVALSSSKGTQRTVTIDNSLITETQQGIENGHTAVKHKALVRNTVLYRNHIALRNGDNYPTLDVFGKVRVEHSFLVHNMIPVLDWVEIDHSKKTTRKTYYDPNKYQYEVHNPHLESQEAAGSIITPALTLSNCVIEQRPSSTAHQSRSAPTERGDDLGAAAGGGGGTSTNGFTAAASIDGRVLPAVDELFSRSALIAPDPHTLLGDALEQQLGDAAAVRKVRHGAVRRYTSADFSKGLFCGRQHFIVEGSVTTNQETWRGK
jgi:hypothetical protein